ncbi:unnamed protein product [Symbiodinium sp. CCMP2592]|nr:unnamed protein product [Symbiodinium sp. CCMP2592]
MPSVERSAPGMEEVEPAVGPGLGASEATAPEAALKEEQAAPGESASASAEALGEVALAEPEAIALKVDPDTLTAEIGEMSLEDEDPDWSGDEAEIPVATALPGEAASSSTKQEEGRGTKKELELDETEEPPRRRKVVLATGQLSLLRALAAANASNWSGVQRALREAQGSGEEKSELVENLTSLAQAFSKNRDACAQAATSRAAALAELEGAEAAYFAALPPALAELERKNPVRPSMDKSLGWINHARFLQDKEAAGVWVARRKEKSRLRAAAHRAAQQTAEGVGAGVQDPVRDQADAASHLNFQMNEAARDNLRRFQAELRAGELDAPMRAAVAQKRKPESERRRRIKWAMPWPASGPAGALRRHRGLLQARAWLEKGSHPLVAPSGNSPAETKRKFSEEGPEPGVVPARRWAQERLQLVKDHLSPSTQRLYDGHWRWWELYTRRRGVSALRSVDRFDPGEESLFLDYLVYLFVGQGLAAATAQARLGAIRSVHLQLGFPDPLKPLPRLQLALEGIRRRKGPIAKRRPVTPHMLARAQAALPRGLWGRQLNCALQLGFFFLLRVSELVGGNNPKLGLRVKDVKLYSRGEFLARPPFSGADEVQIVVRASKTDPEGESATRNLFRSDAAVCPVLATIEFLELKWSEATPHQEERFFGELTRQDIQTALQTVAASLGEEASANTAACMARADMTPVKGSEPVDFEDFVTLADKARMTKVISERRMAGFSPAEISQLEEMFKHYDKDESGDIDSFEVQELLNDFGLPCRTIAERQAALDQLEEAKQLAAEAGVKSPKGKINSMITFWELVQLVRLVKTSRAKAKEEESRTLLEAISFSKQEIDDFRSVFLNWAKYGGLNPAVDEGTLGQRVSLQETAAKKKDTEDLDEEEPGLTHSMFQRLLRSLELQINQQAKQAMEEKLSRVQLTDKHELSFVGFLQMMRWMLDSNFAGINTNAQKVAAARQEDHFSKVLRSH